MSFLDTLGRMGTGALAGALTGAAGALKPENGDGSFSTIQKPINIVLDHNVPFFLTVLEPESNTRVYFSELKVFFSNLTSYIDLLRSVEELDFQLPDLATPLYILMGVLVWNRSTDGLTNDVKIILGDEVFSHQLASVSNLQTYLPISAWFSADEGAVGLDNMPREVEASFDKTRIVDLRQLDTQNLHEFLVAVFYVVSMHPEATWARFDGTNVAKGMGNYKIKYCDMSEVVPRQGNPQSTSEFIDFLPDDRVVSVEAYVDAAQHNPL